MQLIDGFGRTIDYIRISVTKNCNFRCLYCMPNTPEIIDEGVIALPQMLEFLKIAMDFGVRKIRITGGEPLLRKDLSEFIAGIYAHKGDIEVALTTNAYYLAQNALKLKEAGLKRINISLDSLDSAKIARIAQRDAHSKIMDGIIAAKNAGLKIKLNMVPLRGINDDEIAEMLLFAQKNGFLLRYIEYMSNSFANGAICGMRSDEILAKLSERFSVKMLKKENFGPAKLYEFTPKIAESSGDFAKLKLSPSLAEGICTNIPPPLRRGLGGGLNPNPTDSATQHGVFGIIAPHNDDFCTSCNRIRITSDGIICPCLYFEDAVDLGEAIKNGDKDAMRAGLLKAIANKPEKNKWSENATSTRAFYETGG
ncbi:GTP 3',8-cyclase MoaA [Helicobacter sp. 23-1045]